MADTCDYSLNVIMMVITNDDFLTFSFVYGKIFKILSLSFSIFSLKCAAHYHL